MPRLARYCCTYFAVYSFALSVVKMVGYLDMKRASASMEVVSACGTWDRAARNERKAYRVAVSTNVIKYLLFCTELGAIGPQTSEETLCPACVVCWLLLCGLASVFPSIHPVQVMLGGLFCSALGRLGIRPCRAITAIVRGRRWPSLRCQLCISWCAGVGVGDGGTGAVCRTWWWLRCGILKRMGVVVVVCCFGLGMVGVVRGVGGGEGGVGGCFGACC